MSDLFSCPQCHRAILPGDQFCAGCGYLLKNNVTPEAQVVNAGFWETKPLGQFQALLSRHRLITGLSGLGLLIILVIFSLWRPWEGTAAPPSTIVISATPSPIPSTLESAARLSGVSAAAETAKEIVPSPSPRWKTLPGLINVRSRPSLQSEVLLRLQGGETYTGTGQTQEAEGHTWIEIQLNAQEKGWISSKLASAVAPAAGIAPNHSARASNSITSSGSPQTAGRMLNHEKLSGWLLGEPADRQRTARAMTRLMFPNDSSELLNQKALLLETCITGSAEDVSIKNHDVAQIAAICALLLGWQEKEQVSSSPAP